MVIEGLEEKGGVLSLLINPNTFCRTALATTSLLKTRRGYPVDNRPSTDKLHNFVRKKK